jgi:hypothetical protein
MPWSTFLKAHWGAIAAADFFSVEVLTVGGLVRYLVFFVIDLKTRRVHITGIAPAPDGAWMAQVARNLTDAVAGPLRGFGHLIVDRDPLYTAQFKRLLADADVKLGDKLRFPLRLDPADTRCNALRTTHFVSDLAWIEAPRKSKSVSSQPGETPEEHKF